MSPRCLDVVALSSHSVCLVLISIRAKSIWLWSLGRIVFFKLEAVVWNHFIYFIYFLQPTFIKVCPPIYFFLCSSFLVWLTFYLGSFSFCLQNSSMYFYSGNKILCFVCLKTFSFRLHFRRLFSLDKEF